MTPTLSILVATWNCAPQLAEFLDSLAAQSWSDWELLLLDNALQSLLDGPAALGEDFGEQSRLLCERLNGAVEGNLIRTAPDIPLLDEMSRQARSIFGSGMRIGHTLSQRPQKVEAFGR